MARVNVAVAANTGAQRSGTMTIAGQTFTVTQAAPCTYAIAPSTAPRRRPVKRRA